MAINIKLLAIGGHVGQYHANTTSGLHNCTFRHASGDSTIKDYNFLDTDFQSRELMKHKLVKLLLLVLEFERGIPKAPFYQVIIHNNRGKEKPQ